jgi:peptidoglycan glycosyltransferase
LDADALTIAFERWGLGAPPLLEIPTQAGETQVTDPRLAAVGQDELTVTPLHVALLAAALGNEGVMPAPRLALKTEKPDHTWQATTPLGRSTPLLTPNLAFQLRGLLRSSPDGAVIGHSSVALAGAERPAHAWFIGLAPPQTPRYAVVVLLEHSGDPGLAAAEHIGYAALLAMLNQTQ